MCGDFAYLNQGIMIILPALIHTVSMHILIQSLSFPHPIFSVKYIIYGTVLYTNSSIYRVLISGFQMSFRKRDKGQY